MPSTLLATRRLAPAASAASRISIGIDEIDAACRNRSGKSDRVTTNIRKDNNCSVMQLRQPVKSFRCCGKQLRILDYRYGGDAARLKFGQSRTRAENIIS